MNQKQLRQLNVVDPVMDMVLHALMPDFTLHAISKPYKRKPTVLLNPDDVLAIAWNEARLDRCRKHLLRDEKAPPIYVNAVQITQKLKIYKVSDGNHRTIAARKAGKKVLATIDSYTILNPPKSYLVNQNQLWYLDRDVYKTTGIYGAATISRFVPTIKAIFPQIEFLL